MNIINKTLLSAVIILFSAGCANNKTLSQKEALEAYPALAELQQKVDAAELNNLKILSPKAYIEATNALESAHKSAKKGKQDTNKIASQGLANLSLGLLNSEQAKDVFEDVLKQRQRTIAAYGDTKQNVGFQDAEKLFLKLST